MPREKRKSRPAILGRGIVLAMAIATAGCTTPSYKPYSAASPPKPANYPIPAYTAEMRIPRPCELIGTVSVNAGKFTIFGGSAGAQLKEILMSAHDKGADVIRFVSVEKPDFLNPNYRMTANLLRYADAWETVPLTSDTFRTYLQTNRTSLDPIEGIWLSSGVDRMVVGIMKSKAKPGREFVGFMLNSLNPVWGQGTKKLDIRRGPVTDSYVLTFYMEDFAPREIPIKLNKKREFTIKFRTEDDEELLFFAKDFDVFNGQ